MGRGGASDSVARAARPRECSVGGGSESRRVIAHRGYPNIRRASGRRFDPPTIGLLRRAFDAGEGGPHRLTPVSSSRGRWGLRPPTTGASRQPPHAHTLPRWAIPLRLPQPVSLPPPSNLRCLETPDSRAAPLLAPLQAREPGERASGGASEPARHPAWREKTGVPVAGGPLGGVTGNSRDPRRWKTWGSASRARGSRNPLRFAGA